MERFRAIVLIELWGGMAQERSIGAFPEWDVEREASIRVVLLSLANVSATGMFFPVFGQCDIIAVLEAGSMEEIYQEVKRIRSLRGIKLTTTLPVTQALLPNPSLRNRPSPPTQAEAKVQGPEGDG